MLIENSRDLKSSVLWQDIETKFEKRNEKGEISSSGKDISKMASLSYPFSFLITLTTIHMPQRTSKILLVRLTANKNASFFQIRVTCFARYTV